MNAKPRVFSEVSRRRCVRVFFLLLVSAMALDMLPWDVLPGNHLKQWVSAGVNRIGIWQGQWGMFAPNPLVNNSWLTAEIEHTSGEKRSWSSPYWATVGGWEKFYRFRFVNYYNRIQLPNNQIAAQDFAKYLGQTIGGHSPADQLGASDSPVTGQHRSVLYNNGLKMLTPADGTLPHPDEITWVTFSDIIAKAE